MYEFYDGFEKNSGFRDFFQKIKSFFTRTKTTPSDSEFPPYQRKPTEYFKRTSGNRWMVKSLNRTIKKNTTAPNNSIMMDYTKADGSTVTREVTPYSAKNKNLLVAHDHHRDAIRTFRIDRIKRLHS